MGEAAFDGLVARLVRYRLLRQNAADETYTAHPLMRNHYLALLSRGAEAAQTHERIKDYYLAVAGDTPTYPTLEDLAPLIEVVYHACRAGAYADHSQCQVANTRRDSVQRHRYDIVARLTSSRYITITSSPPKFR